MVCDLIEGKRPPGIFLVLDDICKTIHGQSDGVDDKFVQKLDSTISHPHYESRFPRFIVRHYAGDVTYDSDGPFGCLVGCTVPSLFFGVVLGGRGRRECSRMKRGKKKGVKKWVKGGGGEVGNCIKTRCPLPFSIARGV